NPKSSSFKFFASLKKTKTSSFIPDCVKCNRLSCLKSSLVFLSSFNARELLLMLTEIIGRPGALLSLSICAPIIFSNPLSFTFEFTLGRSQPKMPVKDTTTQKQIRRIYSRPEKCYSAIKGGENGEDDLITQ